MEFKGTKGEWESLGHSIYSGNQIIASLDTSIYDLPNGEYESNKKLIVAAPKLLKACQEMWEWVMKQDDWRGEDPKKEWKQTIEKALK